MPPPLSISCESWYSVFIQKQGGLYEAAYRHPLISVRGGRPLRRLPGPGPHWPGRGHYRPEIYRGSALSGLLPALRPTGRGPAGPPCPGPHRPGGPVPAGAKPMVCPGHRPFSGGPVGLPHPAAAGRGADLVPHPGGAAPAGGAGPISAGAGHSPQPAGRTVLLPAVGQRRPGLDPAGPPLAVVCPGFDPVCGL